MKIIFIRHSKTDRNPEIPITCWGLSAEGIKLAQKLSENSVIKNISVIYSSFQTKALETAVLLAKPNALPIKADDRLTEVTSFTGPFEPDFDKYSKNVHDYYQGDLERISGGETKDEALKRFNLAIESISQVEYQNDSIAVISHGNILTLFSAQYKNVNCYELHTQIKQPDIAIFDFAEKKFITFFGEV